MRVPSFPDLFPGELLYSACARFGDRILPCSMREIPQVLFGNPNTPAGVHLPGHIALFSDKVKPGKPHFIDEIINEHTLLPYFAPFLTVQQFSKAREGMIWSSGAGIHIHGGPAMNRPRA